MTRAPLYARWVYACVVLGALAGGRTATAATRYVRGDCGNDAWSGISDSCQIGTLGSKKTIQSAIDVAGNTDRIEVFPGTYVERINLKGKAVQIVPYTLLGSGPIILDGGGSGPVITCNSGESAGTVIDGLTITNGAAPAGGGLFIVNSSPTIINCIIANNRATGSSSSGGGGGMHNSNAHPTVRNCIFHNNQSPGEGGGMFNMNGAHPQVVSCLFYGNTAPFGAGIRNFTSSSPTFINCTIADNSGLGIFNISNAPVITNCIVYGNPAGDLVNQLTAAPVISYSDFGGTGIQPGTGNINANPRFVAAANGDYRLLPASPCIDAGNSAVLPAGMVVDLGGAPRLFDDPCVANLGAGTSLVLDLGAYELQSHPPQSPIHVPADYPTIQGAINHACDGAVIIIEPGTYIETLNLSKSLTLQGTLNAPAIINASRQGSVATITAGVTVTFVDLALEGGTSLLGAGVANQGTLTLNRCTIAGNVSNSHAGGIYNLGAMTLTNCTVSGNTAGSSGGGILNAGTATLTHCTIRGNAAGDLGGGVRNNATLNVRGTIIAGNSAVNAGPDMHGGATSLGHNLVGSAAGSSGFGVNGDQLGVDPQLLPLSYRIPTAPFFPSTLSANTTGQPNSTFVGPPDDTYAGMGNGSVTFDLGAMRLLDEAGPDLNVYEVDFGAQEFARIDVLVSADGIHFVSVKSSEGPIQRIPGDSTHGNNTFARSYDLAVAGASAARYVRINATLLTGDGFDLDAIGVIHAASGSLPTRVNMPQAGSPVIDAADPAIFPLIDQRGAPRPADSAGTGSPLADIGAFEMDAAGFSATFVSAKPACPGGSNGSASIQVVGGVGVAGNQQTRIYCIPPTPAYSFCNEASRINSVVISGGINNVTNSCSSGSYEYFDQSAVWPAGSNQTISLRIGEPSSAYTAAGVWIDWNRDGDFDDPEEVLHISFDFGLLFRQAAVHVPAGAVPGKTRLRVRSRIYIPFTAGDACTTDVSQGGSAPETEDYNVYIISGEDYQYLWSNGATTPQLDHVPAGDYSVTVTDGAGATTQLMVTVPASPAIVVDAGSATSICPGEHLILGGTPTASGGTPPFTYAWTVNGQPLDTPVLDISQSVSNNLNISARPFQTFTATQARELRAVEFELYFPRGGIPGVVNIYSGYLGALLSSTPVYFDHGWRRFDLACPVTLTPGAMYTIVLDGLGSPVGYEYNTSAPYSGGFSNISFADLVFKTYVGNLKGICSLTEVNSLVFPLTTTTFNLTVTDSNACSATGSVTVTVRDDNPCLKLTAIDTAQPQPHILGELVAVTATLSTAAPPEGVDVEVTSDGFAGFSLKIPGGQSSASSNVTMNSLGYGFTATAQIVGFGGYVTTNFDVLPLVQSVTLAGTSPYVAGSVVDATVTLREPALAGGAKVVVSGGGFNPVTVVIPAGQITGHAQVTMSLPGAGYTLAATASQGCARSVEGGAFDVGYGGPLYVNAATGDDVNHDGLSPAMAFATIGKAIATAPEGFRIVIAAGTYHENLVIVKSLKLEGAGAKQTVVDANQSGRPLLISPDSDPDKRRVILSGLTFTHGNVLPADPRPTGGGVQVDGGVVTMTDCAVTHSVALLQGGGVGAIRVKSLTMTGCTISGNTSGAGGGGGLGVFESSIALTNCTISGNISNSRSPASGGGILLDAGGIATIDYCTITGNTASNGPGGGVYTSDPQLLHVSNTILAGNAAHGEADCFGGLDSGGYNILGSAGDCPLSGDLTGNIMGAPPELGPLADNGGQTLTHALLPSSPAIDAASPTTYPPADQRGVGRPIDAGGSGSARADIGSFEADVVPRISTPYFNPPAGAYEGAQSVAIGTATAGTQIHYTMDGTDPTPDSPLYSGPIPIDGSLIIKARAYAAGLVDSAVASAAYTLRVATPVFNYPAGIYVNDFNLTMTCLTPGAVIRYTLDGSDPTPLSPQYLEPFAVSGSITVKARAFIQPLEPSNIGAATFEFRVFPPQFVPGGGNFTSPVSVVIASANTSGAGFRYTLDGTVPTENSPLYTAPIVIAKSATLKAVGFKSGYTPSPVITAFYRLPLVVYVRTGGNDANDGLTWATAKQTVQAGINAALFGDEVWVQTGMYRPTSSTDRTISIALKDGVSVYGGFAGTETEREQRNWVANLTTLSGDIGTPGDSNDNSYGVVRAAGATARLDGFVVSSGKARGASSPNDGGGGLRVDSGSVTVVNCRFTGNDGTVGGAILVWGGTLEAINSFFYGNSAQEGGALECFLGFSSLRNCTFYANTASQHGSAFVTRNPSFGLGLYNCIVWGHTDLVLSQAGSARVIIRHTCFQDGASNGINISADPRFVNAAAGDFRLQSDSPCIDAGGNEDAAPGIATDYAGNPRFHDVVCLPDTGSGPPPVIDMGAYEFQGQLTSTNTSRLDFDHDCDVDAADLDRFLACSTGPNILVGVDCQSLDLDHDGDCDQADFGSFQGCYSGAGKPADPICPN